MAKVKKTNLSVPFYGPFDTPYQEHTDMGQLERLGKFNEYSKVPGFIDEYKNYILSTQFEDVLGKGVTPFTTSEMGGFNVATFNPKAKKIESPYKEPEKEVYRTIWNQLIEGGGKIKQPNFLDKAFGGSMTGGWARLLGDDRADLFKGIRVQKDGIYFKGNKLSVKPDVAKSIADFANRTAGKVDESFLDKVASTVVGLTIDLPLLTLTGSVASGAMKLFPALESLATTTDLFPKIVGGALQQTANFNILGIPQTVEAMKERGFNGALESIYHSAKMGTFASLTGTLGTGIARGLPKTILEGSPILKENIGALAGSFGFGYGSVKLEGGTSSDAVATGLAFAATHFTNPTAYKRVIHEQATKNVEVYTEKPDGVHPVQAAPDYFVREGNKLFKIDSKSFNDKGNIEKIDAEGIPITKELEPYLTHYNDLPEQTTLTLEQALKRNRVKSRANDFLKKWKKDLGDDLYKENSGTLRAAADAMAVAHVSEKVNKLFARWKIPDTPDLYKEIVHISDGIDIPYPRFKQMLKDNIDVFVKDPEGTKARIENSGMDDEVKKGLTDGLQKTVDEFIREAKANDHTYTYDTSAKDLLEYHSLRLAEAEKDNDLGGIAYHKDRIESISKKVKEQQKPEKKTFKGPIKIIGEEPKQNQVLLDEIAVIKKNMDEESRRRASRIAFKALQQPEKTTAEALYGKEGSIKEPIKEISKNKENIPSENTKNTEIPSIQKPGSKESNSVYKTITKEKKVQPEPNIKEFIPEKSKGTRDEEFLGILRKELPGELEKASKAGIRPDFYMVNRLRDKGYGRVKIAETLRNLDMPVFRGLTEDQMKNRVGNMMKENRDVLKEQRKLYDKYVKGNPPKDIVPEEQTNPIATESQAIEAGLNIKTPTQGVRKTQIQETADKDLARMKKKLKIDVKPVDITTPEGAKEWDKRVKALGKGLSEREQAAVDRIVDEMLGLSSESKPEDYDKLYSRRDIPESIKRRYDRGYRQLSKEEIKQQVDKLNKIFKNLKVDWKAIYDEKLDDKGVTDFSNKVIKLGKSATIDTPLHEVDHFATLALGKEKTWDRMLKDAGWDGKGTIYDFDKNPSLREAHEVLAKEFADYALGYTPDRGGIFARLTNFFRRVVRFLKGNGWYSKADYFDKLLKGKLRPRDKVVFDGDIKKYLYSKKLPTIPRNIPEEQDERNTLLAAEIEREKDFNISDFVGNNVDKAIARSVNIGHFGEAGKKGASKAKRLLRESITPPVVESLFRPKFRNLRRLLEENIILGIPKETTAILKDIEGWNDGKAFRDLGEEGQQKLMDTIKTIHRDIYDGIYPRDRTWDQWIADYEIPEEHATVLRQYARAVKFANKIARDGLKNRLMKFNNRLAETVLKDDEIKKWFNDDWSKSQVLKKDGTYDLRKVDKMINEDDVTKEEIADYIANKIYPDFGDRAFISSTRPLTPKTWIIGAYRASNNENHAPIKDAEGNVIGHNEEISTYTEYGEKSAKKIKEGLEKAGYTVDRFYDVGKLISGQDYSKLTTNELLSLVNAGHVDLDNKVIEKLFQAMKVGTYEQHFMDSKLAKGGRIRPGSYEEHYIYKRYVPGMHGTPQEFERGLEDFVYNAVSSHYRQNSVMEARHMLTDWGKTLNVKDPRKRPEDYDQQLADYEYSVKYFNNVTHSDKSFIDGYKNTVSTFFTALKVSFLTQQSLQGLQTTLHLAIAEAKKHGLSSGWNYFYKGTKDAFGMGLRNLAEGKTRLPIDFKPLNVEEEKMKMMQDFDDAGLLGRTYREELFGMGDDSSRYYEKGALKVLHKTKYLMNMMSAGIERFTRIQSFNTFYELGKEKGLTGKDLFHYVADNIDLSMSEWGSAGRPPVMSSLVLGRKQHPLVKALDKSFYTFKTFATHNLGLYEYLIRNRLWGAFATKAMVGLGLHGMFKFPMYASLFAIANLFTKDDVKYELLQSIDQFDKETGTKLGNVLAKGLPSIIGIDMRNLMDENSPFVGDIYAEARPRSVEGKIAETMLGAPLGFTENMIKGSKAAIKFYMNKIEGMPMTKSELAIIKRNVANLGPLALRNLIYAGSLEKDGFTIRGKTVIKKDELSWVDVLYKAMGFNPIDISDKIEEQFYGYPAKIARAKGYIRELKAIRKEIYINKDHKYSKEERSAQLKRISEMRRDKQKELSILEHKQKQRR